MADDPRVFFKIGTGDSAYDLTPFIDIQNFALNRERVYQEWTDGSYKLHRIYIRPRITGKLVVGFKTQNEYDTFLSNINSLRTTSGTFYGSYDVESYVNNSVAAAGTTTYTAYIELVGEAKWDTVNGRQWITQELEVTEV